MYFFYLVESTGLIGIASTVLQLRKYLQAIETELNGQSAIMKHQSFRPPPSLMEPGQCGHYSKIGVMRTAPYNADAITFHKCNNYAQ